MTDLMQRLENYLYDVGLVDPELMDHEIVLDLIMDCRDALAQPEQPDLRKTAEMALEALEKKNGHWGKGHDELNANAIAALRKALIDSDGTLIDEGTKIDHGFDRTASHMTGEYVDTSLPKQAIYEYSEMGSKTRIRAAKTWQTLTEQEISEVLGSDIHQEQSGELRFIRAIEEKLKDKNT
jgi:hypothetical protein